MIETGLADKYYKMIDENSSNAHIKLARMFGELFNTKIQGDDFAFFGRAVKVYGWKFVFSSLIDLATSSTFTDSSKYKGYFSAILKNRYEKSKDAVGSTINLTEYVTQINTQINTKGK